MGPSTVALQNAGKRVGSTNPLPVTDVSAATVATGIGAPADTAATTDTGTFSLIALFKRLLGKTTDGVTVVGLAANPSGSTTRPADTTAYTIGDLVANSTTAGSVVPGTLTVARVAAGSCMLRRLKLHKTGTSTTNAQFRVHLFRAAPTVANGDNGAFSASGVADYLGAFDALVDRAFTDGAAGFGLPVIGSEVTVKLASGTDVRYLIEARGAYTPTSAEVFTVTADDLQN